MHLIKWRQAENYIVIILGLFFALTTSANASNIALYDMSLNINGTLVSPLQGGPLPSYVDASGFDFTTGLGTINISYSPGAAGNYYVLSFFDHDIDASVNTYYNEVGSKTGNPTAGQSWEIDEPGYVFGNIFTNFLNNTLDNQIGTTNPDDVSMAMGYNFHLSNTGDTVLISFILSETAPSSGFYLTQSDPDSNASIYFSSSFTGPNPVPIPSGLVLLGSGLACLAFRKKSYK